MAGAVHIRPARLADAAAIGAVHVRTWQAAYEGIVASRFLSSLCPHTRAAEWQQTLAQPPTGLNVFVADAGAGDIVGFVAAGPERSGDRAHAGEIYALYVLPSQQGSGIGHSLLQSAARGLARAGMTTMLLWVLEENARARRFYEKSGGIVLRQQPLDIGGVAYRELAYGWQSVNALLDAPPARNGGPVALRPEPTIEVDHVFVMTSFGAPEAGCLIDAGLREGTPKRHPGQGTSNRRFFFANAMLELLWVDDIADATCGPAAGVRLAERWAQRNCSASPFGICLRPARGEQQLAPFPSWDYLPPYSPLALPVAQSSTQIEEPLLFFIPFHRRMDELPAGQREPIEHPLGVHELTSLRVHAPLLGAPSQSLQRALATGSFAIETGAQWLLELGFDGVRHGRSIDLRPTLPLLLRW
jgi:ribosomal protein S18 acetylase RimI-like enzyme